VQQQPSVGHLRNILSSLYPYLLHSPLRPNISPGWASEASTVHTQPRHRSQRPTKTVVEVPNLEQCPELENVQNASDVLIKVQVLTHWSWGETGELVFIKKKKPPRYAEADAPCIVH
jgi:hypothetical protein